MNRLNMLQIVEDLQQLLVRVIELSPSCSSYRRLHSVYAAMMSTDLEALYNSLKTAVYDDIKVVRQYDHIISTTNDHILLGGVTEVGEVLTAPIVALESVNVRYELKPEPPALYQKYMIKAGDTLSEIAERFHTTMLVLEDLNYQITNPDLIHAGSNIFVPAVKQHV